MACRACFPSTHGMFLERALPLPPCLPAQIRAKVAVPCGAPGCSHDAMRFKVMMYDDGEGEQGLRLVLLGSSCT